MRQADTLRHMVTSTVEDGREPVAPGERES